MPVSVKYFSLAYPILDTLEHGKRLIVDEFGSKLHTLLITRVISLFNTKTGNPNKAQLISLSDYKVRSDASYEKDYL